MIVENEPTTTEPITAAARATAQATALFADLMTAEHEAWLKYIESLETRIDLVGQYYLTLVSATLGALILVLSIAKTQPLPLTLLGIGTCALVTGTVGMIAVFRIATYRRRRSFVRSRIRTALGYFEELHPAAFLKYVQTVEALPEEQFWRDKVLVPWGAAQGLVLGLAAAFFVAAAVEANPQTPLDLNLWWIIIIAVSTGATIAAVALRLLLRMSRE